MTKASQEFPFPNPRSGIPMLVVGIALLLTGVGIPVGILVLIGLTLVNPNQSKVVVLFGNYMGTLRDHGFYWVNPFSVRKTVSLRAHNFNSDKLKVNDLRGNPIEIGAVVVWRVRDSAQATFDVEDYESYVQVQTESALRHLASSHPYDAPSEEVASLRGNGDAIHRELQVELEQRLKMAGIEVLEVRLSHLAYAPEIAGAMLQRQQAEAIIDARKRIVDGAVGMVQMALEQLQQNGVVTLDEERKAQMVSNLLVVLCSERGTQPIVNAGTLYG
jgi:regulator of protease activity HflC (stomatin/prohibitin superfamily)